MSESDYQDLWHYSERFTRDPLQMSELIIMAWKEGEKLGERCSLKLMKSAMHFRSKELNNRSAFPCKEVGESAIDAWRKELVYGIVSIVNTLLIRGELERGEAGAIFIQSLLSCR